MWSQIAEGSGINLITAIGYEDQVDEGQRARFSLSLRNPLSPEIASELQSQLDSEGVTEAQVSTYGNNCDITYRKGFPWLVTIILIILGLVVLAILIVSWQFSKELPVQFSVLAIGGLALATAALVYVIRRR